MTDFLTSLSFSASGGTKLGHVTGGRDDHPDNAASEGHPGGSITGRGRSGSFSREMQQGATVTMALNRWRQGWAVKEGDSVPVYRCKEETWKLPHFVTTGIWNNTLNP